MASIPSLSHSMTADDGVSESSHDLDFVRDGNVCLFCGFEYTCKDLSQRDVWTHFSDFPFDEHEGCLLNAINYCDDDRVRNNPTEHEKMLMRCIHHSTTELYFKQKYYDVVIMTMEELRDCTIDAEEADFNMSLVMDIIRETTVSFIFKQTLFRQGFLDVIVHKMQVKGFSPFFYRAAMTIVGYFVLEKYEDGQSYTEVMVRSMLANNIVDAIASIMDCFPNDFGVLFCCAANLDLIAESVPMAKLCEFAEPIVEASTKALENNCLVDSPHTPKLFRAFYYILIYCMDANRVSFALCKRVCALYSKGIRTFYEDEEIKSVCVEMIQFMFQPVRSKMIIEKKELEYLEHDCKYSPAA